VADIVLKEYEGRIGKKTMTGRGKKKTMTGRKALLDQIARKLSPVILNAVKEHGLAVKIPDSWSEACPLLYNQVSSGENLDCLIGLLLDMIVSTQQSASSLKFGTAWQSIEHTAKPLDLDDSKLFAYNGEDMDLTKILRLLLQQVEFSSALNSIVDAKKKERQAATSTGKKEKALKKPNKVDELQESSSEDEPSSSGDEEENTTTLAGLKSTHSKKADAVKKGVGKFIADTAGTDGGGHESEYEEPFKWEDLKTFIDETWFTNALHKAKIQKDEKIDPKVYEFIINSTEMYQKKNMIDLEKKNNQIVELENENLKRIREVGEEQKKLKKEQAKAMELAHDKIDRLKQKYQDLKQKLEASTKSKQVSPSSSSSSANKKNKKRTQSVLLDRDKNGSNKKAKAKVLPQRSYDDSDNEENTL
jgi:hypothetical protein